jgi:four helix bundle protein
MQNAERRTQNTECGGPGRARPASSFADLVVWQKAHGFVLSAYQLTGNFPAHELYGLTGQLRRAAVSIAANIAEGFRKRSTADKLRFFEIAHGSLEECRYYLLLAGDLGYGRTEHLQTQLAEVSRLLSSYAGVIRRNRRDR